MCDEVDEGEKFIHALEQFKQRHGYGAEYAFRFQDQFLREMGTESHASLMNLLELRRHLKAQYLSVISNSPYIRDGSHVIESGLGAITKTLAFPPAFRDVRIWALFNALQAGSSAYAQRELPAYQEESVLNGGLFGQIGGMSISWSDDIAQIMAPKCEGAFFSKIDLQIKGREQKTGGDTAVFIEWEHEDGYVRTVPLILQAKRFFDELSDISQKNGDVYQFHTLRDYSLPSAYMFFQNAKDRRIENPLPPLVVSSAHIPMTDHPRTVSALTNSLPLAHYVLRLMAEASEEHRFDSPGDAVRAMAANVNPTDLINVIVLSTQRDAEYRFDQAWAEYLIENDYREAPRTFGDFGG